MYPSDAEWASIPPRRPDTTEPGDGWGLGAGVAVVLLAVLGLACLGIYLSEGRTRSRVGGRILGDVQLSAAGGAAGWRVPHADETATVHWEPSDSRSDVLFVQGDIPLVIWRGNAKILMVTERLPADALVCITYGQGGQYQQCKLPAEWVGK
jgi:hypothetical protein